MRISDWSSDVCSSDLCLNFEHIRPPPAWGRGQGWAATLQGATPLRVASKLATLAAPPARRGDVRSLSRRRPEPGPDRQMVRGARGEGPQVDAGRNGFEVGRGEDAVEPCHRAAAVKAVAGVATAMAGPEIGEATAVAAPFVAVHHPATPG